MSRPYTLAAVLVVTVTVAACSRPDAAALNASSSSAPSAGAAAVAVVHDGRKIEINANDTMKFSTVEIRAKTGERLSVTLVNGGSTPKFSMGHNWVLVAPAVDVDAFLLAAAETAATDFVPASKKAETLAATKLLGPGERDTTTFTAPSPGRYPFLCSFPGHAQVGMRGVLIVE